MIGRALTLHGDISLCLFVPQGDVFEEGEIREGTGDWLADLKDTDISDITSR